MDGIIQYIASQPIYIQVIVAAILFLICWKLFKNAIKFLLSIAVLLILILVILNLYNFNLQ